MTHDPPAETREVPRDRSATEVELKFDVVDLAAARALVESDDLAGLRPAGPLEVIDIVDRYFDTAGGSLQRGGWVGRIRTRPGDGQATVVLKSAARRSRGAVHVRDELEGPADAHLHPAQWPESVARERLLALIGREPVDTTIVLDQRRRVRCFCDDEIEVEVSLDRVRTLVDERIIDRSLVLEVELKSGSAERLEALGDDLGKRAFLVPSKVSKLVRSVAAAERARLQAALPDPATTKTPGVQADDLVGEAGRKVLALHFARMLAREPGTREGRDPEELHQMRVATRRMRAAWRVFGDAFDPGATRALRSDLRDVAAALGTVRDLDVLLDRLIPSERARTERRKAGAGEGRKDGAADGLGPFVRYLRAERDAGRRRLVRLLERPGYQRWVTRFGAFLTSPGMGVADVAPPAPRRIRDTAPSRIWGAYERVRAYGELLRSADVPTLHALRIESKRLRYALEFIQETLGADAPSLIARVTAMQDHLGLLNDADVAAARAREFLGEHGASLSSDEATAIGEYVVDQERDVARLRRTIWRAWRGVDGPTFRRRLGRAVARL
jgi:CHAD domain-containing protein